MDRPEDRPIEVAGTFLRAMAGARLNRHTIDTGHAAATEADKILGSFPPLDECVDDWAYQLHALAAKHIMPPTTADDSESEPPKGTTAVPAQSMRQERRLCERVEIAACINAISAIGATVHAVSEGPDDAPVVRLHCSDGAHTFVLAIEIVLARRLPSDRLGAHVAEPLVFLGTRRLLRIAGPLCVPVGKWKMGGGWRSTMSTNDAALRLLTDLVHGHVDDWAAFADARYAQLAALPNALVRHGYTVVPDDQSAHRRWAWTDHEKPAELGGMALGIVCPDGLQLWVVWKSGTLLITNQGYFSISCTALPVFFDQTPSTPIAMDDDDSDDNLDVDGASHATQDWWAEQDGADTDISLVHERTWMIRRGYISGNVVHARAQDLYDKGERPPLILGRLGDMADEMALRVGAYVNYVRGAYGPVDETTGAHLNGPWCRRHLADTLAAMGSQGRLSHYEGPIDPAGPVVTNSIIEYELDHVFGRVSGITTHDIPHVVAHAHLVGESSGMASAYFSVIIRHCRYHDTFDSDDDDDNREDHGRRDRNKERSDTVSKSTTSTKPRRSSYRSLVAALKEIATGPAQEDDNNIDHAVIVHTLAERNARASRFSTRTAAVLYERHLSGDGVGLVRAHAWMTDQFVTAIRLFEEASAAFVCPLP
ncbi:hypothetical protein TW95_gp0373 [Pandoravirus inopinatum]|uniref:Uncharacterized protein n=1 Tax=Pandoravirus inopinatum TaxID=1605721 RepID=A0A0B5JBZ9_9VIRU|nr:hypothetical protein TW95_gp0373 [Pandoravirus inopinatum]AJF97107.1 hypothetical protein [Pandoravirus inopinatum]